MKIKAYTIMEVTVAMLLSAICISICYTAYAIISNYYASFQKKNETTAIFLSLKQVLERDFLNSSTVLKIENGIELDLDSTKIDYLFTEKAILRKLNTLHTDTFKLQANEVTVFFEGIEVEKGNPVDELNFSTTLGKDVKVPVQIKKIYSAENLFE